MTRDVISTETKTVIEATIDAALQTNDQTVLKDPGLTASATVAPSLQGQTQIPQWSFRRGSTRRGAGERAILRRRRWRRFCRLCSGSVVFGWHFASPLLALFLSSLLGPSVSLLTGLLALPLGFLSNSFWIFFLFTRFLTTPHDTKRRH